VRKRKKGGEGAITITGLKNSGKGGKESYSEHVEILRSVSTRMGRAGKSPGKRRGVKRKLSASRPHGNHHKGVKPRRKEKRGEKPTTFRPPPHKTKPELAMEKGVSGKKRAESLPHEGPAQT